MTATNSVLARIGQGSTGLVLVSLAIGASLISATINYRYGGSLPTTGAGQATAGLSAKDALPVAALVFLLSDIGKLSLLVAIGARSWDISTKATLWAVWCACLAASLWAAANTTGPRK